MSRPYSKDLRERVVSYIDSGNSYSSSSRIYKISVNTAKNWYKRYKTKGHINPIKRPGAKPRLTQEEFETYVNANSNQTLKMIGAHFGMTARSAHYYMKKFGYSYKKKAKDTWSQKQKKDVNTYKK